MNLLLIDSEIPGLDTFIKSCNSNTKCLIYNNKNVTFQMMDKKISSLNVRKYNNLGFVFVNDYNPEIKFLDNKPFISYYIENEELNITHNTTTNFITYLVSKYNIKTIDFFACYLLNIHMWEKYFNFITSQNMVKIRASDDKTGNLLSGGDWILETTGEDIEKLYFNKNINYWNYLLDTGNSSYSTFILTTDASNNLYGCGANVNGQLGLGNVTTPYITLQNITTNISNKKILMVTTGSNFSLLLTNDSTNNLYVCGNNSLGQIGLGVAPQVTIFTNLTTNINGKKIINISAGNDFSLLLTNDNTDNLYGCGNNSNGQLGLGNVTTQTTLQNINANVSGKNITMASAGNSHTLVLTNDLINNLYSCGNNSNGQLGLGNTTTPYTTLQNITNVIGGKKIIQVSGGNNFSYLITNDSVNNLYSCGNNSNGQLGLGNTIQQTTFQNVTTNISGKRIIQSSIDTSFSLILTNDTSNNLYACGSNDNGQMGTGTGQLTSFKISSNTISNRYYDAISSGLGFFLLTTSDNTNNLYGCGNNLFGQLGINNTINQFSIRNIVNNINGKKVLLNSLVNFNTPITPLFDSFNYGSDNATYYPSARDNYNNIISISNLVDPEILFPSLSGIINEAYLLAPISTSFSNPINFTINTLYLSNVYYQTNSELILMDQNSSEYPYYTYDGSYVTIYTDFIFEYLIITAPESNSGAQFSNLNKLIISAPDNPLLLSNTKFDYSFYNTQDICANINNWDISGINTMQGMFRDSSFNNSIINWKPKSATNMSYMFYGANNFNQKISYNPTNQTWDVSGVTDMESIFNTSTIFNNSQPIGGVTEPMNWILKSDVNITNDVSNSALTVANAQTLIPNSLVYLNVGIWNQNINGGTTQYPVNFYNEDGTIGTSSTRLSNSEFTNFVSRYNIAGDSLWNFRIDCSNNLGPTEGCLSTDLSRNIIVSGRWFKNLNLAPTDPNACRFFNANGSLASTLDFSGTARQTNFLAKYDLSGNFLWRTRIIGSASTNETDPIYGILLSNTNCDTNDNIYIIGRNDRSASFENSDLVSWKIFGEPSGNYDKAWIVKYNSNGIGQWLAPIASNLTGVTGISTNGLAINVDSGNNIYGVGSNTTTNVYDASNTLIKGFITKGNWVTKYDVSGNVLWATNFTGINNTGTNVITRSIGYSLNNDVYYCGKYDTSGISFVNQTDISFVKFTDVSSGNGFMVKYTTDGLASWAARIGYSQTGDNTCVCSDKQFQDINYPQQGLTFGIYNGYLESNPTIGVGSPYELFYRDYPFARGVTTNLSGMGASTNGLFGSNEYRSVCWYGYFRAKKTGVYRFRTTSDNGSYLMINGNLIVDNGGPHATLPKEGTCSLVAGTYYYIQIFYGNLTGGQAFSIGYAEPDNSGNATNIYLSGNGTGLGIYYTAEDYINLYDNWVNQSTYVTGAASGSFSITTRKENYLLLTMTSSTDPQLFLNDRPSINPNIYRYIHIKYKVISGTPNILELFYGNSNYSPDVSRKISYTYDNSNNGTWQNIVFDMSTQSNWYLSNWTNYRLDPITSGTATILFEYFIISSSSEYPLNETGNNIYVAGYSSSNTLNIYNSNFYYDVSLNGTNAESNKLFKQYTSNNIFDKTYIVKYNLNGECLWSIFYDQNLSRPQTIKTDKTGNVYVFGQFNNTIFYVKDKYGNTAATLDSSGNYDTYLVAYSGAGNYLWSTKQASSQRNLVYSGSSGTNPLLQGQSMSMA